MGLKKPPGQRHRAWPFLRMALAPLALSCLPALALAVIYELVGTFGLFFSFNYAGRSAKPAVRVESDLPETHEPVVVATQKPAAVAAVEDERADGTISLYVCECIEEADEPGAEIELGAMHMAYRSWCKKKGSVQCRTMCSATVSIPSPKKSHTNGSGVGIRSTAAISSLPPDSAFRFAPRP